MKKPLLIGIVTIVAFALTGCGGITSGKVTGKVIEPERRYSTVVLVGKVPITQWHTDDEDYCLNISEGEETGYICVEKDVYDEIQVGEYIYTK